MSAMSIQINIETEEAPGAQQSHSGVDISNAQAFVAGITGTPAVVSCAMSCLTTSSEGRSLQRNATGTLCESVLLDIEAWLTENAANE